MRGCRSTWWRSTSAGSGPSRRACSRCSGEPGPYPTDLIDNARIYYRDYLRGLTRADAQRRADYGELATRVERELTEEGPDPQEVADAVAALIATPAGQRPPRTLVGEQISQLLGDYNASHQQLQALIVDEDLLGVRP
jgi:hypothetical protein